MTVYGRPRAACPLCGKLIAQTHAGDLYPHRCEHPEVIVTKDLQPAALWPVRTFVLQELEARNTPWQDFHKAMGSLAYRQVMDVMKLCPRTCTRLAVVLATSEEMWQNLDDAFWKALHSGRYYLAKEDPSD